MKMARTSRQDGMALLIATLFVAVGTLVLSTLAVRVINQNRQVGNYVRFRQCFQGLEAASAQSRAALAGGGGGTIGLGSWSAPDPGEHGLVLPSFEDDSVSPLQIPSMPNVQYMAYVLDWANDGLDNNGDGTVDGLEEEWFYTVYTFARNGSVERQAEIVLDGWDVNVWRNAIFGGSGQVGGVINGNVSIHGSVHLLGSSIPEGGEAVTALDLSGASLIHNNYAGLPLALDERIPPLPTTLFNGETIETLNAVLRVKQGLVGMSGNSEIGEPDAPGNVIKETMDGTFVNDGWTGNSVVDDGDRGIPTKVFSDNGWDMAYDLSDNVNLPLFQDDWRDYYTGDRVINPGTGTYYSHEEYFHEVLTGAPFEGDVTIVADADFYYNATRPADPDPSHREPTDDYILFDAATNHMEINGQIEINGNLEIAGGGGGDKIINYTGRAAIMVHGGVTLNTDLLTVNGDGTTLNSFPANNCLGIMAAGDLVMGTVSQLAMMGAFYAQARLESLKQTTVVGTCVSNYFDMGAQVPSIYQVPTLPDNMPVGMVGAYPILVFSQVSWRELGV